MSLFYNHLIKQKNKNILEKIAIYENDEKKISYKDLIKLVKFYKNNLKKLGKNLRVLIILDHSIELIALLYSISKLNFASIIIGKDVTVKYLKIFKKKMEFDYIITNYQFKKKFKSFKNKVIFIDQINKFKVKKKINKNKNNFFISSFSSGTTNKPKPFYYSEKTKFARYLQSKKIFKIEENDKLISYTPIYHSLAQRISFLAINSFSTLHIVKKFNADSYIKTIFNKKINVLFPISSHLKLILFKLKDKKINFLKLIVGSSSNLPLTVKKDLFKRFKNKFVETYGMSETAFLTTLDYNGYKKNFLKSVGKPCYNVRIKIISNNFETVKIGEISSKTNLLSNLDKSNKDISNNFFLTGDLGYLKNNYLFLTGRKKDIIIKSGVNIYPSDIEAEILKYKKITNCVVIGIKDNFFGEVPIAICEISNFRLKEFIRNNLMSLLAKNLLKIQIPHKIIFEKKIKISKTGKINKLIYFKKYKNTKIMNLSNLYFK